MLTWPGETRHTDKVALALIADFEKAPLDLGLGTRLSLQAPKPKDRARGDGVKISLIGQLKGSPADLDAVLARATAIAKPHHALVWGNAPYWAAQALLEEGYGSGYFQERSTFAAPGQAEKATAHAFRDLLAWPGTSGGADLRFFQMGGKINEVDAGATAFPHRNSAWIMDVGLTWGGHDPVHMVAAARAWQDRLYATIRIFSTDGAYVNFPDPSLDGWRHAYYLGNLARLQEIKAKIDPKRVFDFPQAI